MLNEKVFYLECFLCETMPTIKRGSISNENDGNSKQNYIIYIIYVNYQDSWSIFKWMCSQWSFWINFLPIWHFHCWRQLDKWCVYVFQEFSPLLFHRNAVICSNKWALRKLCSDLFRVMMPFTVNVPSEFSEFLIHLHLHL